MEIIIRNSQGQEVGKGEIPLEKALADYFSLNPLPLEKIFGETLSSVKLHLEQVEKGQAVKLSEEERRAALTEGAKAGMKQLQQELGAVAEWAGLVVEGDKLYDALGKWRAGGRPQGQGEKILTLVP